MFLLFIKVLKKRKRGARGGERGARGERSIDALLYKNWFWWGLDLIADGLVLVFVAGTWYLLAMMISGKPLFMQNIARAALLVELIVSWTVWSHHLLSDQAQPAILKVLSGEFNLYMILAAICGTLVLIGYLTFFYNIVMSAGLKGVIGIFTPAKIKTKDLVPST